MKHLFIIPAYRSDPEVLRALLAAVRDFPCIIVDNNESPSEDLKSMTKANPHHKYIAGSGNTGYAGGVNRAVRAAENGRYDWMTVLNDDIAVPVGSLREYLRELGAAPEGIAGPYRRYLEKNRWSGGTDLSPGQDTFDYLSGSFLSVHRDVQKRIGQPDERYFLYYEDAEYCVRAKQAGFPLTYLPVRGLVHNETSRLKKGSYRHQYYMARNHLRFVARNAPLPVKLHEVIRFPKTILEHRMRGQYGAIRGISDFMLGRFGKGRGI